MPYTSTQLGNIYANIHFGIAPDPTAIASLALYATQNAAGTLTDAATALLVVETADADSAVAVASYEFFTGKSPTSAGLIFLVDSATNTTDLNDPYYAQFNQTNRYINFAQNLGLIGEGKTQFQAAYGALTFAQTVASLYETLIGTAQATTAGINVNAAIADIASRLPYFTQVAAERFVGLDQDLAVKAALAGYILSEAMKADVGKYALATENMLLAVGAGTAVYNTDILTTYAGPASGPPAGGGGGGGGSGGGFPTSAPTPSATTADVDLSAGGVALPGLGPNTGAKIVVGHGTNALTMTLTDATGAADVVGVTLATSAAPVAGALAGLTAKLAAAGVEGLYVTSSGALAGGGATNVLNLDATVDHFTRIDVFGAAPIAVNLGAYTVSTVLSGGGATGELQLIASAVTNAAVAVSINGGSANDTIAPVSLAGASAAHPLLYGGGGGDVFNLGAAHTEHDTLLYKAASDSTLDTTNVAGASGTSTVNTGKMDVVNNFISGQDKLDVSLFGFSNAQAQVVDHGTVADAAALATLAATSTFFQDGASVTRAFVTVHIGADDFLFVDTDKSGTYTSSDLVVKLVGLGAFVAGDLQV